jgi:hypothetical protein
MKHQTSIFRLLLLLTVIVFTWVACKPGPGYDPEKAQGEIIPIKKAKVYQKRFRKNYDSLWKITNDTFLRQNFMIPNAETFSRHAILAVLNHPKADSLRIFYGIDSLGEFHLLMLGVDNKGNVIYTRIPPGAPGEPGMDSIDAVENGQTCPPCQINN